MLVIRGVDDEASLSLAAGSIASRLGLIGLVMELFAFLDPGELAWLLAGVIGLLLVAPIFHSRRDQVGFLRPGVPGQRPGLRRCGGNLRVWIRGNRLRQ